MRIRNAEGPLALVSKSDFPLAKKTIQDAVVQSSLGEESSAVALGAAVSVAAQATGIAEFDAFNGWVTQYLSATGEQRKSLLGEGISLATARRTAMAALIPAEPHRAIENAVLPIVRQALPLVVAEQFEERVNEKAFFGVLRCIFG